MQTTETKEYNLPKLKNITYQNLRKQPTEAKVYNQPKLKDTTYLK